MILAVDVGYFEPRARAVGVLFSAWDSTQIDTVLETWIDQVEEYVPGEFFRRELPCIMQLIAELAKPVDAVVIDGFVTLGDPPHPGLGVRLWEALGGKVPVIGVAKSFFAGTPFETRLLRGGSDRPLFITAAGMPLDQAKQAIASMKGKYRMPDFLKLADTLSRREEGSDAQV
ncbi:MAG TPA: endonuclease V [Burkholderiaceae bacterium]